MADIHRQTAFKIGAIEPQPLVDGAATPQPKLYYNGTELVMGTDYICTYEKNDSIGSDAVVILKGIGNYTGSVKKTFKICAKHCGRRDYRSG